MQTVDIIASITTIIANIAVLISVIIALRELRLIKQSHLEDHTRNLRQSTIEFYNLINNETKELIDDVIINKIDLSVEAINHNPELHQKVRRYLSLMERFSVGINSHMYDITVFDRIQGKTTLIMFDALTPYIDSISEKYGTFFYGEFLKVINQIKEIREERRNAGYSKKTEDFSRTIK